MQSILFKKLNFLNIKFIFSNKNITDNDLTNLGKSLQSLSALNSIFLNFKL